jgi:hypothetical protein
MRVATYMQYDTVEVSYPFDDPAYRLPYVGCLGLGGTLCAT